MSNGLWAKKVSYLTTTLPSNFSQKKVFDKLCLPPEHLSMVLDLGKSFVPARTIVQFMRKCQPFR